MVIIQHFKYFWGCFGINSESWIEILIYCLICSTESVPTWCEYYGNLSCSSAPSFSNGSTLPLFLLAITHGRKTASLNTFLLSTTMTHFMLSTWITMCHVIAHTKNPVIKGGGSAGITLDGQILRTLNQPTPPGISGRSSHSLILFLWAVHQSPFPNCPQLTTIIPLHLSTYCQVDPTLASPTTLFFTTSISLALKLVSLPAGLYKISRTSASSSWSVFEARRKWVNLASDKLAADPTSLGFASWFARWIGQWDWGSWRASPWGRGWKGQEWRRCLS